MNMEFLPGVVPCVSRNTLYHQYKHAQPYTMVQENTTAIIKLSKLNFLVICSFVVHVY